MTVHNSAYDLAQLALLFREGEEEARLAAVQKLSRQPEDLTERKAVLALLIEVMGDDSWQVRKEAVAAALSWTCAVGGAWPSDCQVLIASIGLTSISTLSVKLSRINTSKPNSVTKNNTTVHSKPSARATKKPTAQDSTSPKELTTLSPK